MRTTRRQTLVGTVVSNRMQKTIVVEVETQKQHPQYKKYIRMRRRYKAHDENNECELGDMVRCMETRPVSKDKRWRVVEVLRKHFVSTAVIRETDELVMRKTRPEFQVEQEKDAEAQVAGIAEAEGKTDESAEQDTVESVKSDSDEAEKAGTEQEPRSGE